jgi:hypothetical protein
MGFKWEEAKHDAVVFALEKMVLRKHPTATIRLNPSFAPEEFSIAGAFPDLVAFPIGLTQTAANNTLVYEVSVASAFWEFREKTAVKWQQFSRIGCPWTIFAERPLVSQAKILLNHIGEQNASVLWYQVDETANGFRVKLPLSDQCVEIDIVPWDQLKRQNVCNWEPKDSKRARHCSMR